MIKPGAAFNDEVERTGIGVAARHQAVETARGAQAVAPDVPVVVTLTRIAPRALDGDNLQGAFKAMRDEVAKWIGVPDNHPSVTWEYGQRRGGVGEYAVSIVVGGVA